MNHVVWFAIILFLITVLGLLPFVGYVVLAFAVIAFLWNFFKEMII